MKIEKPRIKLHLEAAFPDPEGGIPQKFSVSRSLKAKWNEDPKKISSEILEEIRDYKGSFVGDISSALTSLVASRGDIVGSKRDDQEVTKWCASVLESLIFSGVNDGLHLEHLERREIFEWDGSTKEVKSLSAESIKDVDVEKLLLLLTPRIKHALFLISKDADKESDEK